MMNATDSLKPESDVNRGFQRRPKETESDFLNPAPEIKFLDLCGDNFLFTS